MNRLWLGALFSALALAQSQPAKPAFEAASIKPGPPGNIMDLMRSGGVYSNIDDSHFAVGSFNLAALVQMAFHIPQDQIVEPDWMMEPRFDVQAKLPAGSSKEQVPAMLLTLLEDRFKLTWHHDQKVLPVYALMVAKDGPKLHESSAAEADSGASGCNGGFHKVCRQTTMENLATMLSRFSRMNARGALDRPVIDQTALKAKYDFDFDQGVVGGGRGPATGETPAPSANPDEVTAFEALKVLGLRLEPTKLTYDIIVIDHIERTPTEN